MVRTSEGIAAFLFCFLFFQRDDFFYNVKLRVEVRRWSINEQTDDMSGLSVARLFFLFLKKMKKEAAEVFLEEEHCMDRKISRESITAVRAAGERSREGGVPVGSLFCLFTTTGALPLVSLT